MQTNQKRHHICWQTFNNWVANDAGDHCQVPLYKRRKQPNPAKPDVVLLERVTEIHSKPQDGCGYGFRIRLVTLPCRLFRRKFVGHSDAPGRKKAILCTLKAGTAAFSLYLTIEYRITIVESVSGYMENRLAVVARESWVWLHTPVM